MQYIDPSEEVPYQNGSYSFIIAILVLIAKSALSWYQDYIKVWSLFSQGFRRWVPDPKREHTEVSVNLTGARVEIYSVDINVIFHRYSNELNYNSSRNCDVWQYTIGTIQLQAGLFRII